MDSATSLKSIERKAYRSTFEDGIYDILFGMIFLIPAIIAVLESVGVSRFYGYLLFLVPLVFSPLGKRFITTPRLGAVEFGQKRKSRRRVLLVVCAGIAVLMLPVILMALAEGISGGNSWLLVALFGIPVFAVGVYIMDFPRLYVYAALLIFAVLESEYLLKYIDPPYNSLISFGIPGAVILPIGISLLFRFMKKYRKPEPETAHVE